ncbi:MurR/RpiR family transcriptional regulator [Streptomyces toyocaensis]|uniref:MurR/RpiR family transcriptional regulator n=1 Tax=Streptomyces toyocaensis TaxID=55952 RepID=UPI00068938FF|nr:MurR/RpiR family transcriptional regulator [Streptomyces toyocaensis]
MHAGLQGVRRRLRSDMSRFSRSERRIARLLLEGPATGTDTVSLLARRAGVSAPTVVRFALRCGFAGWIELRDALRAETFEGARRGGGRRPSRRAWSAALRTPAANRPTPAWPVRRRPWRRAPGRL